ncbi:MAG TPA: hypothetical protein VF765_30665 [Polyangiaceae bacterium]
MSACAYRSLEPVLQQRIAALRERQESEAPFVDVARRVASRRIGRVAGGFIATVVGGSALLVALASWLSSGADEEYAHEVASILLVAAWPAGIVAALVARAIARGTLSARSADPVRFTGDLATDLARLDADDPLVAMRRTAEGWECAAAAWPLAALSLVTPLTIHMLVDWIPNLGRDASVMRDFGTWIALSVVLVGHSHLAVLVGSVRWARSLRERPTELLTHGLSRTWGLTLLVAVGLACLPGIVLLGIPPILVAVTGLLFIPLMFVTTARCIQRERFALEATVA